MAVSNQPVTIAYATDGVSSSYSVPFYFAAKADLVVTFKDSTGAVTTKVLNTDYAVNGTLDPKLNVYSNGGTVDMNAPLGAGGQLRITRVTPRTQPVVYQPHDPFPAGSHEEAMDRSMLIIQELAAALQFVGAGDAPPTSGSFNQGDKWWNLSPVPGGTVAWIYLSGNWYQWGDISGT